MNTAQQSARVGLFFLLGLALVWVTFETLSDGTIFRERGYTVIAGFSNLKELKVGDDVRMAGVKIGSVSSTRLSGRRAEALLRIDPKIKIGNDAVASIFMAGLIGGNYLGIDLGSNGAPPLTDGSEIRTQDSADLNSMLKDVASLGQKLQDTLGSFSSAMSGDGKGGGLFAKLDTLVTENSAKINATMTNLQQITDKINQGQGTLGKLVNDPKLHDELLATVEQIKGAAEEAKQFVANAQAIVDQVKSGQGTIGELVYDQKAADDIKATLANIRSVSDKIAKGEGTLGRLINDDSLYNSAQGTLKKADRAFDGLNDSGPIEAVGILANALF
jgi:phospholipid/cholesterol/gamma-HCH transport system substrate-binding protein